MVSKIEIDNKPFMQLILIVSLVAISLIIFSLLGAIIAYLAYGIVDLNLSDLKNADEATLGALKLLQLFTAIGVFMVPPIIFTFFTSKKPIKNLGFNGLINPINYGLVILIMFVSMPIMSWIIELNANMVFPEFLSSVEEWMRNSETIALEQTKAFLTFNGVGSLIYTFIIVAIVPAIGEELLFRGVLQKIFIKWTKNAHWGIWITAFIFSAIHVQFYGFFPRMLLGALLGYLFLWSKSLWLPILGHFINNGVVVITSYFYPKSIENTDVTIFDDGENKIFIYLLSFVLTLVIIFLIKRANTFPKTKPIEPAPEINE